MYIELSILEIGPVPNELYFTPFINQKQEQMALWLFAV